MRIQEVGYKRKDTGGRIQEGRFSRDGPRVGYKREGTGGRVQEGGDIERRRKEDTGGRIQEGRYIMENIGRRIQEG